MWQYRAQVEKVVDGDTLNVALDLGLDVIVRTTLRLNGLNAAEHNTPEGQVAKDFVVAWITRLQGPDGWFLVNTLKDKREKFGRYLATVIAQSGENLNADLIGGGYAKPWDGHGPKPV